MPDTTNLFNDLLDSPMPATREPMTTEERLRSAVEFAFYAAQDPVNGGDGELHAFEVTHDGDGWNEPFSVSAACVCGTWRRDWTQTDREQSDRVEVADLLLEWVGHYEALTLDTPPSE